MCSASAAEAWGTLITALSAKPVFFKESVAGRPGTVDVRLSDRSAWLALADALRRTGAVSSVPKELAAALGGDEEQLARWRVPALRSQRWSAGAYYAVLCGEWAPAVAPDWMAKLAKDPKWGDDAFIDLDTSVCAKWGIAAAPLELAAAGSLMMPGLVMHGEFDPESSAGATAAAAERFASHTDVLLPRVGDGTLTSSCGTEVARAFLAGLAASTTACISSPPPWAS
jgi:hypothetical protein